MKQIGEVFKKCSQWEVLSIEYQGVKDEPGLTPKILSKATKWMVVPFTMMRNTEED